jgi:hypothetical protein
MRYLCAALASKTVWSVFFFEVILIMYSLKIRLCLRTVEFHHIKTWFFEKRFDVPFIPTEEIMYAAYGAPEFGAYCVSVGDSSVGNPIMFDLDEQCFVTSITDHGCKGEEDIQRLLSRGWKLSETHLT